MKHRSGPNDSLDVIAPIKVENVEMEQTYPDDLSYLSSSDFLDQRAEDIKCEEIEIGEIKHELTDSSYLYSAPISGSVLKMEVVKTEIYDPVEYKIKIEEFS